ncbi:NAD(+)--arginine ADP-ribosyltransferase EFV [Blautia producta]|uniref:NAD(+)--arginine ADP-ribosyltransferase EFV n=1 Tax=Blautia producta TaxID=33035 RepID=A0A4P6M630_9FIRM|nr:minor capsid protein [Blautia producta]QBF00057.1 NAD(+)--arginine ADP-ribosyltransferase EFV [Blautia producta]
MKSSAYWEQRQVQDAFNIFQKAEGAADQIANLYLKSSRYLSSQADDVFERYKTKHELSETEARQLISTMQDRTSLDELLQKLRSGDKDESKRQLLSKLEAPAYQARLERLRQIQSQLDVIMANVYQQEKLISADFYTGLASDSYYRSIYNIQQRADAAFSFGHVSARVIDQVINSRWSGKNYSERIWGNTQMLAQDLKEELLINLVTGRTNREAAAIIANKFGQGASNARRLVRTESNYVSTEMNFRAYQECGIKEYQYLATLDLRTSKICRVLDGKIFLVKERQIGKNCPPMHPWCRSTTISVVDRALIEKMQRSAIDPATGKRIKVPRSMTYQQWYDKYVKGKPEVELEEKKIQNRSSDRAQYHKYKKILGTDIPETLDDFQNMKYNETEKWKYAKLDYKRRNELAGHPEQKLPNAENAIVPDAKFTKYIFDGVYPEGLAKGQAFSSRLGYDINNWQELQNEIKYRALKYPAAFKDNNGYGDRYEQKMVIYGKNGMPANVIVGWMHKPDGSISMSSAYIKEV